MAIITEDEQPAAEQPALHHGQHLRHNKIEKEITKRVSRPGPRSGVSDIFNASCYEIDALMTFGKLCMQMKVNAILNKNVLLTTCLQVSIFRSIINNFLGPHYSVPRCSPAQQHPLCLQW